MIPEPVGDAANPALAMQRSLAFLQNLLISGMDLAAISHDVPGTALQYFETRLLRSGITGKPGSFKSTIISLALNHFGFFSYHSLPANRSSTENNLETLLFLCKDAPMVIDDFAPGSNSYQARAARR